MTAAKYPHPDLPRGYSLSVEIGVGYVAFRFRSRCHGDDGVIVLSKPYTTESEALKAAQETNASM